LKAIPHTTEPPTLEVADIFRRYGEEYRSRTGMTKKQHEVMYAVSNCRTSAYGFHVDQCTNCGHTESDYNSCRDRHCPKCQGIARKKWIEKRLENLLPVPYYHAVFTLPHFLHGIILYNRELIYELLFSMAAQTLSTFGRDSRWLGGELGFFGVLHTWGQTLWQHPHVHFITAGGALREDGQWVTPTFGNKFLFPVKALSKVFRGKFVAGLKKAYYDQRLIIPPDQPRLQTADHFERWVDCLVARNWVVFCKSPFADAEQVVKYVGRYTHRVAISNQRLIGIENGKVRFWFKDYKDQKIVWKQMCLDAHEFIRRFLWHVLPQRFHKIRHFGFLSNGRCKAAVKQIQKLFSDMPEETDPSSVSSDGNNCPICQKGSLVTLLIRDGFNRIVKFLPNYLEDQPILDTS
jgi:hypothetical protein